MDEINRSIVKANKPAKYWVDQAEALGRLELNDDFKLLVSDVYLTEKVLEGVRMLATEDCKLTETKQDVVNELTAISAFKEHLETIRSLGVSAKQDQIEY